VALNFAESAAAAYIALGSNLGDRWDALVRACQAIAELPFVEIQAFSSLYESRAEAQGLSQPDYLNTVLAVNSQLDALSLWQHLASVESSLGRSRPPGQDKAPRTIDIDLIAYGDVIIGTAELTLPHPCWSKRGFVVYPLAELGVISIAQISLSTLIEEGLQRPRPSSLAWPPQLTSP
jgi:2-amino-4-hydroxy-6-hydroxymethyldihydropteridine pyrophosphokinase